MCETVFEDGMADLVEPAGSRLLAAAYRLCGDWCESEDLVQEAWERFLRHIAVHEPPADRVGYLMAIMRNVYYTERRRARWSRETLPGSLPGEARATTVPDAAGTVADRVVVQAALGTLPPGQRRAVALRYLHDQSLAQVAARLGCTVGTAASQISRGLVRLRCSMEG